MQPVYSKNKVISNEKVCDNIYKIKVMGSFKVLPGQFYNLRSWGREPLLSRPISIYDVDDTSISFLYEIRGIGTKLISEAIAGSEIELLGPLGNGFDIEQVKGRVAMVTGGVGIAPLLLTSKQALNCTIDLFSGFRDKSYSINEFDEYINKVYISTDTGNEGHKGFITELLDAKEYDVILTCGPEIMMKKVARIAVENNVKVFVSMESHMACGVGACLVCTCKTVHGMKRTCKDGPIFRGEDVI